MDDYMDDYIDELLMSSNPEINEFIRNNGRLKWIPYKELTNIEYYTHGGFGVILKAKWKSEDVEVIYVVQCSGISQDPETKNYLMIMHYFEDGSLRQYLNANYNQISLKSKLANELLRSFKMWYFNKDLEFRKQYQQVEAAEDQLLSNNITYQTHPQSVYTSRLLNLISNETDFYISENLGELDIKNND
ncbi:12816_t:CDS:2 [Cetraspora pellucida]|uniref:12816_t:CDS:1 n=1 Tax=Cetraspora pellucida TaxID=1433469 RepID=A0A9N9FSD3_9GLOM|nr:12816_t:CDS:2 [Cetraspora pellucida]